MTIVDLFLPQVFHHFNSFIPCFIIITKDFIWLILFLKTVVKNLNSTSNIQLVILLVIRKKHKKILSI
jgi:hypothetical protein